MASVVHVVHCIDTEGPLHESVEATFERLKSIFGLDLEPSAALLARLQAGEVDLDGIEAAVQTVVDPHLLAYNNTWDKIDAMLAECVSPGFRNRTQAFRRPGLGLQLVLRGPRGLRRQPPAQGHRLPQRVRSLPEDDPGLGFSRDGVQFHYHPHNFRREANHCATHWWASSDSLHQILSRRVIDRQWFPAAHRAGFHVLRPDSHWFLEQHVPFDLSSQATVPAEEDGRSPTSTAAAGVTGAAPPRRGSRTIRLTTTTRFAATADAGSLAA